MLDRLPSSLQQSLLLEWLSPTAVCAVARAGSSELRKTVTTSPRAFRAAEGEILRDGCIRWFQERMPPPPCPPLLVLWTTVETDKSGSEIHKCNGRLHRDGDLPAIVGADGTCRWYQNGQLHRDGDEPAVCYEGGLQWWKRDRVHRDGDMPAVVLANGMREWFQNGVHHRDEDRPAIVRASGSREWFQNGLRHRDGDKPAFLWYSNGMLHRQWYQNGKMHRGGHRPAVINSDGLRHWYRHGELYEPPPAHSMRRRSSGRPEEEEERVEESG